jgi:hypothetical protein
MSKADNEEVRDSQTIRLEGRIVGPIRRSTLGTDHPDPEWQSVGDVLYWSFCCRLQATRLAQSFMSEFPFGKRLYTFQRKRFATTSFDEHNLVIAAGNLGKALDRAPKFLRRVLPKQTLRALQLLRNIYEHWEDMRAAFRKSGPAKTDAALNLVKEFPEAEPWTIAIHPDGNIDLANVVFLSSLSLNLRRLEASAHWRQRQLRREGRHKASELRKPFPKRKPTRGRGAESRQSTPSPGHQADG